MNWASKGLSVVVLLLAISACTTTVESASSASHTSVTRTPPSAAELQRIVASGVPVTTKTATDWCTADPLPVNMSGTTKSRVMTLDEHPKPGREDLLHFGYAPPKRAWCFVRNDGPGEPEHQCRPTLTAPTACGVDGAYFTINVMNGGPPVSTTYWWLAFTNFHTGKTRVAYVISEP